MSALQVDTSAVATTRQQIPALRYALTAAGAVSDRLAVWLARQMYFSVRRRPAARREQEALQRARRFEVTVGGRTVPAYEWGEGERTILFIHGWEGNGGNVQGLLAPLLAAGFRVISFDAPGHGKAAGKSTDLLEMGQIAAELISRFAPVHGLIGHSFGGMVVSHVLQLPSVAVERAALIASMYSFDTLLAGFRQITGASPELVARLRTRIERDIGMGWYERSGETLLPRQRVPSLIVHDEGDRDIPMSESYRIHRHWLGSKLHITHGKGHHRILTDADVAGAVCAFFTTNAVHVSDT